MKCGTSIENYFRRVSLSLYRLLLCAYPRRFRRSYQFEMQQLFADLLHDAHQRGPAAVFGLWAATFRDIVCSAFREHRGGGSARRKIAWTGSVLAIVFGYMAQAQAQFIVSAAASSPIPGWQRMERPSGDDDGDAGEQAVWVSPVPSLTADDIDSVQPRIGADGRTVVQIQFTEAGSEKMSTLSASQVNQPIAMLLDGELIWAPVVRGTITDGAEISGGPNGLTPEQVQRILDSANP